MKALRLAAWRHVPKPAKPLESLEPYNCWNCCANPKTGWWRANERASRACSRVDLPEVLWDVIPSRLTAFYMGRHGSPSLVGEPGINNWQHPPEVVSEGCPGGWYQGNPFVDTVLKYVRRRIEGGGRVPNHRRDACTDRIILEAAEYFENEQERCIDHRNDLIRKKMEKERQT